MKKIFIITYPESSNVVQKRPYIKWFKVLTWKIGIWNMGEQKKHDKNNPVRRYRTLAYPSHMPQL